jgi:hypothetical protein
VAVAAAVRLAQGLSMDLACLALVLPLVAHLGLRLPACPPTLSLIGLAVRLGALATSKSASAAWLSLPREVPLPLLRPAARLV